MIYRDFQGEPLSGLGFGTMRLPTDPSGAIDEAQLADMVAYALSHGVNYFDTAYPYHGGMSEIAIGRALQKYPRQSFYLATKFPGHQIAETYDPAVVFEDQLKKCGVEYFDFYLLHNVYEKSIDVYTDPRYGIVDYFREQKRQGRIRHLGFSCHGRPDNLRRFLDLFPDMEFCQIQLNYLDWTLQEAKEKYDLLTERGIPVWVMEPVRGGKLADIGVQNNARLNALRPDESVAAWAFRWLQALPNVTVVLSGMSDMAQMEDNVRTFTENKPLNDGERALLADLAESLKNSLPCTACRYCCDGCPMGLSIPDLLYAYNDVRYSEEGGQTAAMQMQALPPEKRPSACIGCGACAAVCPQKIDIPAALHEFADLLATTLPDWEKVSAERERAAKEMREKR